MAKVQDFDRTLETNLRGAYFCTKEASRVMLRQRYGRIVNISSVVGVRGNAGQTAYAASKAGLLGFTKAAAKELAAKGITVNAVAPGIIDTDMTRVLPEAVREGMLASIPAGRAGTAEEVAQAVAFCRTGGGLYYRPDTVCGRRYGCMKNETEEERAMEKKTRCDHRTGRCFADRQHGGGELGGRARRKVRHRPHYPL